jgi:hypothetical protein
MSICSRIWTQDIDAYTHMRMSINFMDHLHEIVSQKANFTFALRTCHGRLYETMLSSSHNVQELYELYEQHDTAWNCMKLHEYW